MEKDVIVLNLPDTCTNPSAQHRGSSYLRKEASGKKNGGAWSLPVMEN